MKAFITKAFFSSIIIFLSVTIVKADTKLSEEEIAKLLTKEKNFSDQIADHASVGALNSRGRVRFELGNYSKALEDFTQALRLSPEDALIYHRRCNTYNAMGNYEEALKDCNQALSLDPFYEYAYNTRSLIKSKINDSEGAASDIQKAIDLDPLNTMYYTNLSHLLIKINNYKLAKKTCIAGFKVIKKLSTLKEQPKPTKAAEAKELNVSLLVDPRIDVFYSNCSFAMNHSKNYQKGFELANKSIELNSELSVAYINRGIAEKNMNREDEAYEDFIKAIELESLNPVAYFEKAELEIKKNNLEAALKDFKKAVEVNSDPEEAFWLNGGVAKAYYRMGKFEESLDYYNKAIELKPNHPRLLVARADVETKLGQIDKAKQDLLKAKKIRRNKSKDNENKP